MMIREVGLKAGVRSSVCVDTVQKQTAVDLYFFPELVVNHYGAVCDWASMSVKLGCETNYFIFFNCWSC